MTSSLLKSASNNLEATMTVIIVSDYDPTWPEQFEAIAARAERHGDEIDDEYFEQRAAEGVEGTVLYRGDAAKLINQLLAGVRSAMSYSDAHSLAEFHERAEFIQVTALGYRENTPHATH